MIRYSDIRTGDIIRVLDEEDELYAKVCDNRGDTLEVHYLEKTNKTYNGAIVYELNPDLELTRMERVSEHYPDGETIFEHVKDNCYVLFDELEDSGSDITNFLVSDSEFEDEYC